MAPLSSHIALPHEINHLELLEIPKHWVDNITDCKCLRKSINARATTQTLSPSPEHPFSLFTSNREPHLWLMGSKHCLDDIPRQKHYMPNINLDTICHILSCSSLSSSVVLPDPRCCHKEKEQHLHDTVVARSQEKVVPSVKCYPPLRDEC